MRLNSLAARLIATAAIWTMLGLVVGGLVLSAAFRAAALDSFDAGLRNDLSGLLVAAHSDAENGLVLEQRVLNPDYDRVYSGRYFDITPEKPGQPGALASRSLFDARLKLNLASRSGAIAWGETAGPDNQHLRVVQQRIEFPDLSTETPSDARAFRITQNE